MKKAINPVIAPLNNNTTHRIANIDFAPTIEDVEINIQYNKNKNMNVLKNPMILNIYNVLCMMYNGYFI
jgi:hypothetical protein